MNWDDLRIAIAVHKSGSYTAAAAQLGIDETTVARRLARLQRDLGVPLFEAVDGVRKPTPQCAEILAHADRIAKHVTQIETVGESVEGLVGRYRIATTDSIAVGVLAPKTAAFLNANPGLTVHFLASTENVNFSRWEADLAIRLQKPDKGDFIISKLADLRLFLFEPIRKGAANGGDLVCAYPEDLAQTPESRHMAATGLLPSARCMTKNLLVVQSLIRSRTCSGILPEFMAAEFLDDRRLKATRLEHKREVWLLVQPHLKDDPGARIVIDWVRECFSAFRR